MGRFWKGWMPLLTTSASCNTRARSSGVDPNSAGVGKVASSQVRIARLWER